MDRRTGEAHSAPVSQQAGSRRARTEMQTRPQKPFSLTAVLGLIILCLSPSAAVKHREWRAGNVLFDGARPPPREKNYNLAQIARKVYIFGGFELISGRVLLGDGRASHFSPLRLEESPSRCSVRSSRRFPRIRSRHKRVDRFDIEGVWDSPTVNGILSWCHGLRRSLVCAER